MAVIMMQPRVTYTLVGIAA